MFVLTYNYDEEPSIVGIFSTMDKAKQYVETIMERKALSWTSYKLGSAIWANSGGSSFFIAPVENLDSKVEEED